MLAGGGMDLRRRADEVKARLRLSDVIGKSVKLAQRGGEFVGLCPFHHDTKLGSFTVNDDKEIYKCFSCQASGDHFRYLMERTGKTFIEVLRELESGAGIEVGEARPNAEYEKARARRDRAAMEDRERRTENAVKLWRSAHPMQGTPAQAYLEGRGIDFGRLGRLPSAIRYRDDCWNGELKRGLPTMLSAMIDIERGHVATHRTFLEYRRGRWIKAKVDQPKMTLGSFGGAHIPLHKGACGRMTLREVPAGTRPRVSEGIEDGLTVAMVAPGHRVIAAATLGNLGALKLPEHVTALTFIRQNDDEDRALRAARARAAGDLEASAAHERAAAEIAAVMDRNIAAHQAAGRDIDNLWPDAAFKDFNDQLRGVRMDG